MNRAIVFVDGDNVKVVFGNSVKTVKVSEFGSKQNHIFLNKLFSSFNVFIVDQVRPTSRNKLLSSLSAGKERAEPRPEPDRAAPQRHTPVDIPVRTEVASEVASEVDILTGKTSHAFLKSLAKTTLIIDDLPTGVMISGTDIPQHVSVGPGRTVNLGALDQESIQKSKILRSLMRRKILVPVTPDEANRAETEYSVQLQEENDARLDYESPIIDGPAADYVGAESQIHDAMPINLDEGADAPPEHASNEDSGGMDELMAQIAAAEQDGDIEIVELDGMEEASRADRREGLNAARQAIKETPSDHSGKSVLRRRE